MLCRSVKYLILFMLFFKLCVVFVFCLSVFYCMYESIVFVYVVYELCVVVVVFLSVGFLTVCMKV